MYGLVVNRICSNVHVQIHYSMVLSRIVRIHACGVYIVIIKVTMSRVDEL